MFRRPLCGALRSGGFLVVVLLMTGCFGLPAEPSIPVVIPTATLDPALARQPTISIESPEQGAAVSSPVEVSGRVSVAPFENNLLYRVYDFQGNLIGSGPVPVTSDSAGPGGPGTFAAQVTFEGGGGAAGRIEILDQNQADGTIITSAAVNIGLAGNPVPAPIPGITIEIEEPLDGAEVELPVVVEGTISESPWFESLVYRLYDVQGELVGSGTLRVVGAAGLTGRFSGEIAAEGVSGVTRIEVLNLDQGTNAVLGSSAIEVVLP